MDSRIERVLISAPRIRGRVRRLGRQIARDHAAAPELHLIGVLTGAFVFMADLVRAIAAAGGPPLHCHFVRASTYGPGIKGAGETVRRVAVDRLPRGIAGQTVILVEDILDQGFTLHHLIDLLRQEGGVAAVKLCVLLDKQLTTPTPEVAALRAELTVDYRGFTVPDRWVAGYGLDVGEEFRELPDIVIVRESCFA